jgi:hypothetical protein
MDAPNSIFAIEAQVRAFRVAVPPERNTFVLVDPQISGYLADRLLMLFRGL